jgi:hypothetical protein
MNTMNQVSVGGRHIQYILENVLGQTILREDKGHPLKQDDKKEYKLADGIITTNGSPYIEIRFYQDYILTVTDNLFTFPIHTQYSERHIMKVLTDKQQEEILIYCGFKEPKPKVILIIESDSESEDEEIQPHCYKCFNMNMSINVNCFYCDKLYCKSHSHCILGDDDMPYCSEECFFK